MLEFVKLLVRNIQVRIQDCQVSVTALAFAVSAEHGGSLLHFLCVSGIDYLLWLAIQWFGLDTHALKI